MRVSAVDGAPAEVVAEPGGFGAADERFEAAEMFAVEGLGRAEVHGDAVLDDAVAFEDLVEDAERTAAIDHVVFGDDFEPIGGGLAVQDVIVMGNAQTDPYAVIGERVVAIDR